MFSFVMPLWLAWFIAFVAVIYLVSGVRKVYEGYLTICLWKKTEEKVNEIAQASKDPQMHETCKYALYQIGKAMKDLNGRSN